MSVTIATKSSTWTPVEINIQFETREQLAAFVEMYGAANSVADAVIESGCMTGIAREMGDTGISKAIAETIDVDTWQHLIRMVDQ